MSGFDREALCNAGAAGLDGDAHDFQVAADRCLSLGDEATALVALDRAYGLAPDDSTIATMRAALLDRFAVVEHGLVFRYVPAGSFLMGSTTGDPDERPVHPVCLDEYWIADVPITWSAFCELAGWSAPPDGMPPDDDDLGASVRGINKIRMQYCEGETQGRYDRKPMVTVSWFDAELLARRMTDDRIAYGLPSEAEWEKAARGGLIGKRYPWGDEPPTPSRCDCDHFGDYRIADPRSFPSNGYGLYGMSGGVWEWTANLYDALAYGGAVTPEVALDSCYEYNAPDDRPQQRVLRGGSWADAATAVTVSFRAARTGLRSSRGWGDNRNPNVGFRLVRRVRDR